MLAARASYFAYFVADGKELRPEPASGTNNFVAERR
jgi:hypothetical protein